MNNFTPTGAAVPRAGQGASAPKWSQLRAIEDAREPLGLRATSINILRAMLSFMSADRVSEMAPDHHVVYASNQSIAQRACVSVQTVERHISKLVEAGIIQRVCAANGKRWARRNGKGQVTLVSGLSLLPLSTRHAEFTQMAAEHQRLLETLQALRDQCVLALARLQETIADGATELFDRARLILRRRPQQDVLQGLLAEINAQVAVDSSEEDISQPINLRGSNNENEGHKDHQLNHESKRENLSEIQFTQADMERSFPRLCAELRLARSNEHGQRMMDDLAEELHLGQAWWKCREMGPAVAFVLLGHMLERLDRIENHKAYLRSMTERLRAGEIKLEQLVC